MATDEQTRPDGREEAPEKRPPKALWQALKRILRLARPYRRRLGLAIVLTSLSTAVWLVVPLGLRELLDAVFQEGNRALLDRITLGLLALFLLRALIGFAGSYLLEWTGERIVADLRVRLYGHLHRLGLRFFASQRTGELTSRLTSDVGAVRSAVTNDLVALLTQSISMLGSLALMVALNVRLSILVFLVVPAVALAARYFGRVVRRLAKEVQDRLAEATASAEEALAAIRVVKAFAREPYETRRYAGAVERLFGTARKRLLYSTAFWSGVGTLFMVALTGIFWFGGTEVLAGRLSTGDLVAFLFYAMNIAQGTGSLSRLYTAYNSAAGASERIFDLLDEEPEVEERPGAPALPRLRGHVRVEGLTFAYEPGHPVLRDLTFEAEPGEVVALVGPSGAGKTTLMNLLPRFYDADEGRVLLDGRDVRDVQLASLREQFALVPQEVHLFADTVRQNIRYGRLDATDDEVEEAARAANAHTFIQALPHSYDSEIGERGVKLSGGQRQRLAIARALLRDARLLLLDEATSALDSHSEALVQEALARLMEGRTTFIIAHRLSTVQHADQILVLDEGRLVETGTHETLLARGGLYADLARLQLTEPA